MAKINEFQTTVRFDVEGNAFREPLRDDNILATGGDLNVLAGYDYFANSNKHYTKNEILTVEGKVEPNFRIKDTDVVPSLANDYSDEYRGDQHVMLRSVSYKVYPATLYIRRDALASGASSTSTLKTTAEVFVSRNANEIVSTDNKVGTYTFEYAESSDTMYRHYPWRLTIPPADLISAVGEAASELPLQFTIVETYRNVAYAPYHTGTLADSAYRNLLGGVEQTVINLNIVPL